MEQRRTNAMGRKGMKILDFNKKGLQRLDMSAYQRSFVSGEPDGDRIRVHYFFRPADKHVLAEVWFGPKAEGPPGHIHGGAMASVLDESMTAAAWLNGHPTVAATLTTQFKNMLAVDTTVRVEAWIENVESNKLSLKAEIVDLGGKTIARAGGLFIELPIERFGEHGKKLHATTMSIVTEPGGVHDDTE